MRKFLRRLAVTSAVLCSATTALAQVVTFENPDLTDAPWALFGLLTNDDVIRDGKFAISMLDGKAGAQTDDIVGALINDPASCADIVCPRNNATQYLAALNDGVPILFQLDGGAFSLASFDASFIANGVDVVPSTAMGLRLVGYDDLGEVAAQQTFFLSGPVNGGYDFKTFDATAFSDITELYFIGYACDAAGNCTRGTNDAQFALDNITFISASAVSEPASWALTGLALLGIRVTRRRRPLHA